MAVSLQNNGATNTSGGSAGSLNQYYNPLNYDYFRPWHMSAQSAYEVQRQNNFAVYIDMGKNSRTTSNNKFLTGDLITLAVDSCPLPDISNPTIELAYQNSKVKVAGAAEFGDIDLTVKDFITTDVERLLWDWRLQVYNPQTGQVGWAEYYKKNGYISQYAPDGTHERSWRLVGLWPQNLGLGDLNYDGGDKKTISMTLAVDFAWLLGRAWKENARHGYNVNDTTDRDIRTMQANKLYTIDSGSNYAMANNGGESRTIGSYNSANVGYTYNDLGKQSYQYQNDYSDNTNGGSSETSQTTKY